MQRKKLILPPPSTSEPLHRELALGMQGVWACALCAGGADVFAPMRPLDPDLDPFEAVAGMRGAALMHDGAPLEGSIDTIVLAQLSVGKDGWRCRTRLLQPDGGEIVLRGWAHPKLSGPLDVMTATLRAIAGTLDLEVPETFGWRQLLGVRTIAAGLDALCIVGRQTLERGVGEPLAPVH